MSPWGCPEPRRRPPRAWQLVTSTQTSGCFNNTAKRLQYWNKPLRPCGRFIIRD